MYFSVSNKSDPLTRHEAFQSGSEEKLESPAISLNRLFMEVK